MAVLTYAVRNHLAYCYRCGGKIQSGDTICAYMVGTADTLAEDAQIPDDRARVMHHGDCCMAIHPDWGDHTSCISQTQAPPPATP